MQEIHSKILVLPSTDPAAIRTGNATTTGATIDTQGYEHLEFVVQSGVITDGQWATQAFGSNAANMSGEVQLTTATGLLNADLTMVATTDNSKTKRQGINPDVAGFRYYRLKLVQTGATTGGFIDAQAILANPKVMPTTSP